ncbi:hypothetical protein [Microbacterium sp. zg.Y909]|uniref:hypothetical protein n=1 Tax=Microbacterium sp. zg.Y909 TaxID=2969413 RepID=UPI00214BF697|nr:hypothetical protein [Microbacterium sp. zg.Y909]MCR2825493.1 hypothetical protein [Microbacterium sp. zg.Y909]
MRIFVIAESAVTNSLGRAISLAVVGTERATTELWAVDDGPVWTGARHFDLDIRRFDGRDPAALIARIRDAAADGPVLVWISKGFSPLDRIASALAGRPNTTVIADFDDDDVSLMREQVAKSWKTAVHLNVLHRKSPTQVRRAQTRMARAADGYTFSSRTLERTYLDRDLPRRASAIVPHARPDGWLVAERGARAAGPLRLAYLGTVRPHKGADKVLALVEAMPEIHFSSFSGSFRPAGGGATWHSIGAEAALSDVYADIDFTLVPQDLLSSAARNQLPSKIVEAAVFGVAVVATPTPVIEEYCAGAYVPIEDWSDPQDVARRIRAADPVALGAAIRRVFLDRFSSTVSGAALGRLLEEVPAHAPSR